MQALTTGLVHCAARREHWVHTVYLQFPGQANVLASAAERSLQTAGLIGNSNITQCQPLICAYKAGVSHVNQTAKHRPAAICTTQSQ